MAIIDELTWFKLQFQTKMADAVKGTPFTTSMLAALAYQETGEIWSALRKKQLSVNTILELCVGDIIDKTPAGGRNAFPRTKAELLTKPNGQAMFAIGREAFVNMAKHITAYQRFVSNPDKFCHGYGIFQYDLQFFLTDPEYFLSKKYIDFNACLGKCLEELTRALKRLKLQNRTTLSDMEMAAVAIAYNTGTFRPALGLKQGFKSPGGKFYGELFFDYLSIANSIHIAEDNTIPVHIEEPAKPAAAEHFFEVEVVSNPLRLRSAPNVNKAKPNENVIAFLPDGHIVKLVAAAPVNGFLEVETSLNGTHFNGFAAADFLKPVKAGSVG